MRKYTRSFTLLFLSAIAIFSSCNKGGDSSGNPSPIDTSTTKLILSNMFAGTRTMTPTQSLEVNAGTFQVVYAPSQTTRLMFYPNSFKDKNGNIITSGQIDIKIVEMYSPGRMIANRSSTVWSGRLLQSGGQVYIKAYRAGQEVFPTVYGIGFNASHTNAAPPMALFYGNNMNQDSITTWTQAPNNAGTLANTTFSDTSNNVIYYQFDSCTNFNWINCDLIYNTTEQLVNLTLVSKDTVGLDKTNTQVFLVFPSINSVTYMQKFNDTAKKWTLSDMYLVPANMPFHAVSISLRNGLYYYSEVKNLTTKYEFVDTLRPQQKSLSDVINALGGL
ncbi:MAG TPA: hypothetical protein PL009_04065 [Flavipsychrobacter sp.]|nr:hypothetical protein [Flavipsychrobacter sp.]